MRKYLVEQAITNRHIYKEHIMVWTTSVLSSEASSSRGAEKWLIFQLPNFFCVNYDFSSACDIGRARQVD